MNEEAKRISACVNFCAEMTTEDLEFYGSNPFYAKALMSFHLSFLNQLKAYEHKVINGTSTKPIKGLMGEMKP